MTEKFEEKYMDVLHNIETAIVGVYRDREVLTDHNVDKALDGLIRVYQAQNRDRPAPNLRLREHEQEVFDMVKTMCDWRLGQIEMRVPDDSSDEDETPPPEGESGAIVSAAADISFHLEPKTVDEIIACLKRIRKSVSRWTKQGGRQGYLMYIDNFIP